MHVGFIMDGNGRFATKQGNPRLVGHKKGIETVKDIVQACPELGISTMTLFAFAIANWKRDKEEVDGLWRLFSTFFQSDAQELIDRGIRVVVIGNREGIPADILELIRSVEERSKNNSALLLQIALNYDGIDEIARLIRRTLEGNISASQVDVAYVKNNLDTQTGNEPDIVVRTGMPAPKKGMGVWRSSAFLPVQSAQSVCVATTVLWPDFTAGHLQEIIEYADPSARLYGGQRKLEHA